MDIIFDEYYLTFAECKIIFFCRVAKKSSVVIHNLHRMHTGKIVSFSEDGVLVMTYNLLKRLKACW